MSPLVIRSFLLGLLLPVILGLTRTDFYPYGVEYGDTELRKGDEVSSHPIPLFSSVYFYGTRYQSLFVSIYKIFYLAANLSLISLIASPFNDLCLS
ncbi:Nidogen 1 [Branchiostoma belcheri]|nr:Nidogen 1 [Branchiostoma belcheri]